MKRATASQSLSVALVLALVGCRPVATPLQKAIRAHDVAAVRSLLRAGVDDSPAQIETARVLAFTSLERSGESPSVEVLRLMLAASPARGRDRLVDASFRIDSERETTAIELAVRSWNAAAVRAMIDAGLTVGSQGTTDALVYAIADGNEEAARSLVEAGASSSARASASSGPMGGATPLEAARRKGNAALEDLLTSKGAR
jgi:ankyrin repeat protein